METVKRYKIVVFVPESHSEIVRNAIGEAGAGVIGNYSHCTHTVKGITRFKPLAGAQPVNGEVGEMEESIEDRIETVCAEDKVKAVLQAIDDSHPYEQPATDVYPIEVFQ